MIRSQICKVPPSVPQFFPAIEAGFGRICHEAHMDGARSANRFSTGMCDGAPVEGILLFNSS